MPNPHPRTDQLPKAQCLEGVPLSKKVIGTRYQVSVYEALMEIPALDRQAFIRAAVEEKLNRRKSN
jgi:hypothetical protein